MHIVCYNVKVARIAQQAFFWLQILWHPKLFKQVTSSDVFSNQGVPKGSTDRCRAQRPWQACPSSPHSSRKAWKPHVSRSHVAVSRSHVSRGGFSRAKRDSTVLLGGARGSHFATTSNKPCSCPPEVDSMKNQNPIPFEVQWLPNTDPIHCLLC